MTLLAVGNSCLLVFAYSWSLYGSLTGSGSYLLCFFGSLTLVFCSFVGPLTEVC
ncbi:hypothetical protein BDB01DRAFT_806885 [Pilobolus umbonatus]|nr:hypothetical protein BDB01DRAFT_806885 [Pilobolus umbonatus]